MPGDIREYLLDRFKTDATTLRLRADAIKGATKPSAGPNAALSAAMAIACDHVVALAEQLPENASVEVMIDALEQLVPKLTALANSSEAAASPALRSVYLGACTRAQELIAAESHPEGTGHSEGIAHDVDEDDSFDDDFADDVLDDEEDDDDHDELEEDDPYDDHRPEDHRE